MSVQLHKKSRMANIEMLRILAMMMVVSLHFLAKGDLLEPLAEKMSAKGYVAWLLESFSIMAVDVYVLISGYFLVETGFRLKRLVNLVLQTMFYTCLVPIVLIASGILPVGSLTLYDILLYVFPTNMLHYWFLSAYVLMFLFTPVLNVAVRAMKKQQLQWAIIILLVMESVSKTLIPVRLELDNLGYDAFWFMVVYLIAAYIRLYGIPFFSDIKKSTITYLGTCLLIFTWTMGIRFVFLKTGQFQNFMESAYGYNHLFTITGAVALFYTFYYLKVNSQKLASAVCKIAPYTFGVYLLHEHVNIRYEWPRLLGAETCDTAIGLVISWLIAILIVMVIGIIVDYLRSLLFTLVGRWIAKTKIPQMMAFVDEKLNG